MGKTDNIYLLNMMYWRKTTFVIFLPKLHFDDRTSTDNPNCGIFYK